MQFNVGKNYSQYKNRREKLYKNIKNNFSTNGILLLFGAFEQEKYRFLQDSNFYYFTGLNEPATVLVSDLENKTDLYVPNYGEARTKWVTSEIIGAKPDKLNQLGINSLHNLGNNCKGYAMAPKCTQAEYENLIKLLEEAIKAGKTIFTVYDPNRFAQTDVIIERLCAYIPGLLKQIKDVSPIMSSMRRAKDQSEIVEMQTAVEFTVAAQAAAASIIEPDLYEYEVQGALEFVITAGGGSMSFPSIVATGANATVLHYVNNNGIIGKGDLVIVDVGAEFNHYCGDLTRTYPASGTFNKRQREIYTIVLETQEYIESIAAPGYWLNNKNEPDKSLHHLAIKFLEKTQYGQYFTHGIGHFLGLDVHDVGDYGQPLKENDVITIEPGLYIPQENMGIRIEDNYVLTKNGVYCLSEELPKDSHDIEEFMAQELDEIDQD